ncbi:MAG: recombination protein O N-terminal domain-containing protein [Bacteriovoracales bacterium]|nr:recombination protein O N-terminal domain-containing protein [Bacteriovoracales bacterium]
MRTKIQGLLLGKNPFRERDVIGRLLLRNGKRVSVLFYGGRGGGKKMKSSPLEVGHLLSIELGRFRQGLGTLYSAKECCPLWHYSKIRNSFEAFSLLCFYLELIAKASPEDDLSLDDGDEEHCGLFRVLSNAIFYLEDSLTKDRFSKGRHLAIFLSKLIIELGITPNLDHCLYSDQRLSGLKHFQLLFEQGGFVDEEHLTKSSGDNHQKAWTLLSQSWKYPYGEMTKAMDGESIEAPTEQLKLLYDYLLFQTQIPREKMKTASFVI